MPRPKKAVPSLLRHKSSGQSRVQIGGKDVYLGRWGSKEAREAYARIVAEFSTVGPDLAQAAKEAAQAPASITVAELCLLWLDHAELTYTKNGRQTSHVGTFATPIRTLRELYGSTTAAQFGPLALEAVRGRFVKLGLGRRTANRYAGLVRKIFRWGVSRELVPPSTLAALNALEPLRAGRTEAPEVSPVLPVDDATVNATLAKLSPIVADMVRLQRVTGMRPQEVCNLRPGDVDRSRDVWEFRPGEHKTQHKDRARVVYFGPKAQAIVARYLLRAPGAYCFSPREASEQDRAARHGKRKTPIDQGNYPGSRTPKTKPIRQPGERYTSNSYRVAISRACERAFGMPRKLTNEQKRNWRAKNCWAPNQLRHTFATEARRVAGLEGAQVLLGHAEMQVTQVYAERDRELAISVAAKIG